MPNVVLHNLRDIYKWVFHLRMLLCVCLLENVGVLEGNTGEKFISSNNRKIGVNVVALVNRF